MLESQKKTEIFGPSGKIAGEIARFDAEPLLSEKPEGEGSEARVERDLLKTIPFYPDLAISEATAIFWTLCLLSFLVIFFPAQLEVKANPMITPAGSKPEWYFLFLYAFLRFVPPAIGVLTPIIGLGLLLLLPWLDRNRERSPNKRILALLGGAVLFAVIAVLTAIGYSE